MTEKTLVDKNDVDSLIQRGKESRRNLDRCIKQLFEQGRIPSHGWGDLWIKYFLHEISLMDSNNFQNDTNGTERDGRIQCPLVAQRHFHLRHGIGRAGDVTGIHPKAAGSSLLAKLANSFAFDVIRMQGVKSATACILMPIEMGMALVITMLALKQSRPNARYVIWPRIDQKSCFIPILTCGLEPVIVENVIDGDNLVTNISKIKSAVGNLGREQILCVLSSTCCFAPRIADKLEDIACICEANDIPHIINNTYGLHSLKCMHLIEQASEIGRVDAFLQSTEKNFLVPVGGSIIAGFQQGFLQSVGRMYPGKLSSSPVVDFVITMLSVGDFGYNEFLKKRKELYYDLKKGLSEIGGKYGERCLDNLHNELSLALTLKQSMVRKDGGRRNASEFGSYIFKGYLPTARVVTPHKSKSIGEFTFQGWGTHGSAFPFSYLTVAVTVGVTNDDVERFLTKLDRAFEIFTEEGVSDHASVTKDTASTIDSTDSASDISLANSPRLSHNSLLDSSTIPKGKKEKQAVRRKPVRRPSKCQKNDRDIGNESSLKSSKSLTRRAEIVNKPKLRTSRSLNEMDKINSSANETEVLPYPIGTEKQTTTVQNSAKNDRKISPLDFLKIPKTKIDGYKKTVMNNPVSSGESNRAQNSPETSFWIKESELPSRGRVKRTSTNSSHASTSSSNGNIHSSSSSILSNTDSIEIGKRLNMPASTDTPPSKMTFIVDI